MSKSTLKHPLVSSLESFIGQSRFAAEKKLRQRMELAISEQSGLRGIRDLREQPVALIERLSRGLPAELSPIGNIFPIFHGTHWLKCCF